MTKFFGLPSLIVFSIAVPLLVGCETQKEQKQAQKTVKLAPIEVESNSIGLEVPKRPLWRMSEVVSDDIVHMDLAIKPDWEKQQIEGNATLFFSPYNRPLSSVAVEGKAMIIKSVRRQDANGSPKSLSYEYNDYIIDIDLDTTYQTTDTFSIVIEYIARPTELYLHCPGLDPYSQGMFFVQPGEFTPTKPKQLWTQGEPEDASVWFPTNDAPNERFTHTLKVELPKGMTSLSNGHLVSVEPVKGSDRELHFWRMDKPHAPYLVMLAAGEFEIIKDRWNGMDVHYYVEPEYKEDADRIFGKTPEMLTFFSKLLDYPYPWNKYHQICVRDYTSGAMENTTAVIFGEFVQKKETETLGDDHELIVAHELFHHWFGDLVTCESWAQIPLNEAFANYSEYLWLEHKYGRAAADQHHMDEMQGYFSEFNGGKQVDLIRYDYKSKEDMFDAHSYNKGGRILHMLRQVMGDSLFFGGLSHYLKTNAFKPVEVHHLRLALEEYSGRDLSWFFNQWFLAAGHLKLEINQGWIPEKSIQYMIVNQVQDLDVAPIYAMPVEVDFYFEDTTIRYNLVIDAVADTFAFEFDEKPLLVNFDAAKMLLCEKSDLKSPEQFVYQFRNAPLFMDQMEALTAISNSEEHESLLTSMLNIGFESPYYKVRAKCANICGEREFAWAKGQLKGLLKDEEPVVRNAALDALAEMQETEAWMALAEEVWTNDPALSVRLNALEWMDYGDSLKALGLAKSSMESEYSAEIAAIADIFSRQTDAEYENWFRGAFTRLSDSNEESDFLISFGAYLANQPLAAKRRNLDFFEEVLKKDPMWIARLGAYFGIIQFLEAMEEPAPGTPEAEVYESAVDLIREYLSRERNEDILKYF